MTPAIESPGWVLGLAIGTLVRLLLLAGLVPGACITNRGVAFRTVLQIWECLC